MKLNSFDEKIHSLILLEITLISIVYFFVVSNFFLFIPVYFILLFCFSRNHIPQMKMLKIIFAAFLFSFACSYFVVFFPNEKLLIGPVWDLVIIKIPKILFENQFKVFIRVGTISSISIISILGMNFEKIMIHMMKSKKVSTRFGYPMLLAFNSIFLLRDEYEKIKINAKFRKLPLLDRINIFFPLLVFAIRHADRGAMSLVTRGLTENKSYYFDTNIKLSDRYWLSFVSSIVFICGLLNFFLK